MLDLGSFFAIEYFMPHGHCYLWRPNILWLNVLSDAAIALAYVSIPFTLLYFIRKRKDLPFSWIFLAFGLFIISCGITHVMEIVTVWIPIYAVAGLIKLFTAVVSLVTALLLIKLVPLALSLPSPAQLREVNIELGQVNEKLHQEILERRQTEVQLTAANKELETLNQEVLRAAQQTARMEALRKSEQRFMQVVESAPNAMVLVNSEGLIELTNAQVEKIFGYTRAELIGQPVEILIPERFQAQHPGLRHGFFSRPVSRPMGLGRDLRGLHKSGHEFPIEIGLNPIDSEAGTMILASVVDLSMRVKAAESLSAHAQALERRNIELNNFAYVASHDLKSPLHGIDQLACWLMEDWADKLGPEGNRHLKLMRVRINRMENLLDDLLAYARAGRTDETPVEINTATLVQDVFEFCRNDTAFELCLVGDFPHLRSLKTPLSLVFRNLINNAIKHHDQPQGIITLSATMRDAQVEFSVADDGPGIDPKYTEQVFTMFQTLKPRDQVEGSGMGLAIIKKTLEAFGGTISLSANKPRGAIFTFTWPRDLASVKSLMQET